MAPGTGTIGCAWVPVARFGGACVTSTGGEKVSRCAVQARVISPSIPHYTLHFSLMQSASGRYALRKAGAY